MSARIILSMWTSTACLRPCSRHVTQGAPLKARTSILRPVICRAKSDRSGAKGNGNDKSDASRATDKASRAAGNLGGAADKAAGELGAAARAEGAMMEDEMRAAGKELSEAGNLANRQFQADAAEAVDALDETARSVQGGLADMAGAAVNAAADAIESTAGEVREGQRAAAESPPAGATAGGTAGDTAGGAADQVVRVSEPVTIPGVDEPLEKVKGVNEPVEVLEPVVMAAHEEGHEAKHEGSGGSAQDIKLKLVEVLASLDRGVAATREQQQVVQSLCREMEAAGGPVVLSWEKKDGKKPSMAALDGRWRLIYSSGFASGSLGGARPGPSIPLSPLKLGQVYQDIQVDKSELDNVVDLIPGFSLVDLPGVEGETPVATARLKHTLEVVGGNTVEITFEETTVKLKGGVRGWLDDTPKLSLPGLQQLGGGVPKNMRSARFDVVFLDDDMRITKGDRGEVRVFVKGGL